MTHAMTTEARRAPGGRRPAQSPCFLFGAKGASAGKSIKQRQPFRCNKTKTSRMAEQRSSWSPSRHHHQGPWQARTNFSQDKCTRCSPSKWPIVGALPAQYLGRGPGPRSINRASHHSIGGSDPDLKVDQSNLSQNHQHKNSSPREAVLTLYCSSSAQEAIHRTTHWSRVLHHNGGPNQYKHCVSCVDLFVV